MEHCPNPRRHLMSCVREIPGHLGLCRYPPIASPFCCSIIAPFGRISNENTELRTGKLYFKTSKQKQQYEVVKNYINFVCMYAYAGFAMVYFFVFTISLRQGRFKMGSTTPTPIGQPHLPADTQEIQLLVLNYDIS